MEKKKVKQEVGKRIEEAGCTYFGEKRFLEEFRNNPKQAENLEIFQNVITDVIMEELKEKGVVKDEDQ